MSRRLECHHSAAGHGQNQVETVAVHDLPAGLQSLAVAIDRGDGLCPLDQPVRGIRELLGECAQHFTKARWQSVLEDELATERSPKPAESREGDRARMDRAGVR